MGGSTPNYNMLIGNGIYQSGGFDGYILCNGSFAQCSSYAQQGIESDPLLIYGLITAPGDDIIDPGTVYIDYTYDEGLNIETFPNPYARNGYNGYAYVWFNAYIGTDPVSWKVRLRDSRYGSSQWVAVNYHTLTVHVQDLIGNPLQYVSVFIDGVDTLQTTDISGNIAKLVSGGNHVISVSKPPSCYGLNTWAPVTCTTTVNVTADMTQNVVMCITNDCTNLNLTMYGAGGVPTGYIFSCFGTDATHYTAISVNAITPDITPKTVDLCITLPWQSFADCIECGCETPTLHENEWSSIYTNGDQTFRFKIGSIWNAGDTRWCVLEAICWHGRPNQGVPGVDIDTSQVFVDCLNGDNNHSGLCTFDNAIATITKAQTIVSDHGTIFVMYGNCLNETLSAVLNPNVSTVHISPRESDVVEGTGSVVIDGT